MNEKVVTWYDGVSFEQRRGVGISSRMVVNQTGSFIESIDSNGITGWVISRGIYLRAPRDELSSNGPIGMLTFVKRYTGLGTTNSSRSLLLESTRFVIMRVLKFIRMRSRSWS
jgi:hypothetical protein